MNSVEIELSNRIFNEYRAFPPGTNVVELDNPGLAWLWAAYDNLVAQPE